MCRRTRRSQTPLCRPTLPRCRLALFPQHLPMPRHCCCRPALFPLPRCRCRPAPGHFREAGARGPHCEPVKEKGLRMRGRGMLISSLNGVLIGDKIADLMICHRRGQRDHTVLGLTTATEQPKYKQSRINNWMHHAPAIATQGGGEPSPWPGTQFCPRLPRWRRPAPSPTSLR